MLDRNGSSIRRPSVSSDVVDPVDMQTNHSVASMLNSNATLQVPVATVTGRKAAKEDLAANDQSRRKVTRSLKATTPVPTIIVDPSPLFRAGLAHILGETRFHVRAHGASIADLPGGIFGRKNCIALISLDQNPETTLKLVAQLTQSYEGLRVIVLVDRFCPHDLFGAIGAGAGGYLLKNEIMPEALFQSLELVLLGAVIIPRGIVKMAQIGLPPTAEGPIASHEAEPLVQAGPTQTGDRAVNGFAQLSGREQMILQQLTQGAPNKLIARELNMAEATVKVHIKSLLRKIGVRNRTQAATWALGHNRSDAKSPQ